MGEGRLGPGTETRHQNTQRQDNEILLGTVANGLQPPSLHHHEVAIAAPALGPQIHWGELLSRFPEIESLCTTASPGHVPIQEPIVRLGMGSWDWLGSRLPVPSWCWGPRSTGLKGKGELAPQKGVGVQNRKELKFPLKNCPLADDWDSFPP